jgi:protein-L-isoaspartate(D-aspartate) O-methyltransferase
MHAYARTFALADIREGDRVLDLGSGTGFGCAVLRSLVGESGAVWGVEVDPALAAKAQKHCGEWSNVAVRAGDAVDPAQWGVEPARITKVCGGFALEDIPESWSVLAEGCVIVAPIGGADEQRLVRATRRGGRWVREPFDAVVYVRRRTSDEVQPAAVGATRVEQSARKHLPIAP